LSQALYGRLPVLLQNAACTLAGWQRSRSRFNRYFHRTLSAWQANLSGSVEPLHALQLERLSHILRIARERVPYYQEQSLEPLPADASLPEVLAALPVLPKEVVRERPEAFRAEGFRERSLLRGKTSGTTSSAIPLWYTPESMVEEWVTVWRQRCSVGVGLRDPHWTFAGNPVVPFQQEHPPFWRHNLANAQVLFSVYHLAPRFLAHYVEAMQRLRARYVVGYPSALHLLARALLDAGRPLAPGRLLAVFSASESVLAYQREAIEAAFGAPLFDRYGSAEFATSMTACAFGNLHVDMEFGIVEVEVEEADEEGEWERGPLLVTGLSNEAMPFIRYRIGDVGTRLRKPCPCGRPGDVFRDVDGRIEDYVQTPDGRWIGRLDHVFKGLRDVAEAQVLQREAGRIEVTVVPGRSWGPASPEAVRKAFAQRLGPDMGVEIRLAQRIEREKNGKFRAVRSLVGGRLA